ERRTLPPTAGSLSRTPHYRSGACKDSSKMAIGRSEDWDNPWDCNGASSTSLPCLVPDPRTPSGPAAIRAAHKGRTYDRNRPERNSALQAFRDGGRPHMRPSEGSLDRTDSSYSTVAAGGPAARLRREAQLSAGSISSVTRLNWRFWSYPATLSRMVVAPA